MNKIQMAKPGYLAAKFTRETLEAIRAKKPPNTSKCWAWVRQPSSTRAKLMHIPRYDNCRRIARKGHLTCSLHADREELAQSLFEKGSQS